MAKIAIQGGVKNYLGNQKTVSGIPIKWQSGPDAPDTELAYITKAEKNLLLKKDLHGSLKNGPNTGPEGIMSLDSQGDKGTYGNTGQSYGDRQTSDKSAEVGDRGGGYQEKGDPGYQATIDRIRAATSAPKEKKKLSIPSIGDIYKGYNKFRYNTVNALIPGQKERIEKYRKSYANYLRSQGVQVPGNLLDEDLSNYFFDGAFDKNQNFEGRYSDGIGINTPYMDYGTFMATKMGSPHIKYAGNVGGLGDKYVTKYEILEDGSRGKPLEYGYTNIDEKGNFLGRGEGEGQNYLPLNYGAAPVEEEKETQEFTFDPSRFGSGAEAADVRRASYIFNQGGRVPRNMGGIMNAVPRQGYFLGKIVKGVKKVVGSVADAAGKVLKSDFGKAALAGAAFYYGGGGGMPKFLGGKGLGGFSPATFFSKANPLLFTDEKFNPLKLAGLTTLTGALMGPAKQDPSLITDRGGKMLDSKGNEAIPSQIRAEIDEAYESGDAGRIKEIENYYAFLTPRSQYLPYPNYAANGGRIGKAEGGLMNLGGMEKDYRAEGGFVPIGKQEKADDVPARLSVNEFVFTADAVRNAGGGDIDKGAEVMENMMKNLENGGTVSQESQGNTGAKEMFSVSERIGEVI